MKFNNNLIRSDDISSSILNSFTYNFGISIEKISVVQNEINKIYFIKNLNEKLKVSKKIASKYPSMPNAQLALAIAMNDVGDVNKFKQFERYGKIRESWLSNTNLDKLDIEFLWPGIFCGSLGNVYAIESLIKANLLGLRKKKKLILLLEKKNHSKITNRALFSYLKPHLTIIDDKETIIAMKKLENLLTIPLGHFIPLNNQCPQIDIASNIIEKKIIDQKNNYPIFNINSEHKEIGNKQLKKIGLSNNSWYVTLHVREPGYKDEKRLDSSESFRNANILDYIDSIKAITKLGGWVFRMGDPSMTKLPKMQNVVDYAHSSFRSDIMDVFLGATCKFCIGTGSGYYHIPMLFSRPVLYTNNSQFIEYFGLRKKDLYLPRWLRNNTNKKMINFSKFIKPPISMNVSKTNFQNLNLTFVKNTSEEIKNATLEMIEKLGKNKKDNAKQNKFKKTIKSLSKYYGNYQLNPHASISRHYLEKNYNLFY